MIRVACTALLKRIVAGRANKNGTAMVGGGEDVTSDCIKAIIEFVGVGGIHEVTVNGKPMYEIEIRTVQPVEQDAEPLQGMERAFSSDAMGRRDELDLPGATTYIDRFVDALGLLCRSKPSKAMCEQWLNGESEDLQSWAVSNARIYWQMGIGTIEAAQHLADNPEEGEGHEGFTADYADRDAQPVEQTAQVPQFDAKHVSLKERADGKLILTLLLDGVEGAPRYKVMPVNPGVVRVAQPVEQTRALTGEEFPETPSSKQAARVGVLEFHLRRIVMTYEAGDKAKVPLSTVIEGIRDWLTENGWKRNSMKLTAARPASGETN